MSLENRTISAYEAMKSIDVSPTFLVSLAPVATVSEASGAVPEQVDRAFEALVEGGRFDALATEARRALEAGDLLDL